ncbi:MAG: metallophosphoesterase [Lachnospiraceae bacterium]|nr:metallophosphoesterase [Lachnospiraceae bacterium]
MKVLVVADEESRYYYDYYQPGRLDDIELIISCGDLSRTYLEFLVTLGNCPLLYVCGNHDDTFADHPPEGCVCIEDTVFLYRGLRFAGLGGSYRYRPDGIYMYTEKQMARRIRKLWWKIRKNKGVDVLVTHAPAFGKGDLDTLPHRGFRCFLKFMEKYRPRYMLHGHVHRNYGFKIPVTQRYLDTEIINACGAYLLDLQI